MKTVMTLLAAFISACSFSQQISIAFTDASFAYIGMHNRVSCTIEGLSNKQVMLSTDNGVIEKDEAGYIYRPERVADSKIVISKKVNGKAKKVGEYIIPVRQLPAGVANIGGLRSGTIRKGVLLAQMGIGCHHVQPPNVCLNYTVLGYTLTIFRGDSMLFNKQQEGNHFTEEIKQFCASMQSKDKLLVHGITYHNPDGTTEKACAIELEIE